MKRRYTKPLGRNRKMVFSGSEDSGNSDSGKDSPAQNKMFRFEEKGKSHHSKYRRKQFSGDESGIFAPTQTQNLETDQEFFPFHLESTRNSSSFSYDSSSGMLSETSDAGSIEDTSVTPEVAQQIFEDCSGLYKARKINAENAFKLKLVECITEILKLDQFIGNLVLAAHVIEIGGVIYRCRVDCTYKSTCRLVELVSRLVQREQDSVESEQEQFPGEDPRVLSARKNRKSLSKGRHVSDDDVKLNTQFEYRNSDAALRRGSLQARFTRYITEDMDFNYSSYFKSMNDGIHVDAEQFDLASDVPTVLTYENTVTIPWLPFNLTKDYDPEIVDIWGQPLDSEAGSSLVSLLQTLPSYHDTDGAFKHLTGRYHVPRNSVQVDEDDTGKNYGSEVNVLDCGCSPNEENWTLPKSMDEIRTLDDLRKLFESYKTADLVISTKYGWEGPKAYHFRPPNYFKASKWKKHRSVISYENINLEDSGYMRAKHPSTLELSHSTINKWMDDAGHLLIPYESNYDKLEVFAELAILEPDYSKKFTTFFNDPDRPIDPSLPESLRTENIHENTENMDRDESMSPWNDIGCELPRVNSICDNEISSGTESHTKRLSSSVDYFKNSDSLLYLFPEGLLRRQDIVETEPPSGSEEFEKFTRFIKKPKTVDMAHLKDVIRDILKKDLCLNDDCQPTVNNQTSIKFLQLVESLESEVSSLLANITIPLIFIGLLHVVAETKLFLVPSEGSTSSFNPWIVCRGTNWIHQENIPGDFGMM